MAKRFRAPPASRANDRAASGDGGGATTHGAAPPARAGGRAGGGRAAPSRIPEDHVVVAEFGRAHGVRGEVRLKSWTADPAAIADYGPLVMADGRRIVFASLRQAPGGEADMFVVQIEGIGDRTAAEALARQKLFVPRAQLPALDDEDEFYLADLVGLTALDDSGRQLGEVVAVHDFGAGDMIEVRPAAGLGGPRRATAMVAFTRQFVPVVDLAGRRVVLSENPFGEADQGASGPGPEAESHGDEA